MEPGTLGLIFIFLFLIICIWGIADGLVTRNRAKLQRELSDFKEFFNDERARRRELEIKISALNEQLATLKLKTETAETLSKFRFKKNIQLEEEIADLKRRLDAASKRLVKERELKKTLLKEKGNSVKPPSTPLPLAGPDSSYI